MVGAGLIGTETAATLAAAHEVTLVDMLDRPLARFLPRVSDARAGCARQNSGCAFSARARSTQRASTPTALLSIPRPIGDLHCDVVVSAAGFRSSLPAELAGTDTGALTLPADERLRVIGHERLWACGDCVSFPHPRWGRIAIPHWDHAFWSGRHVAESILGSTEPYVREPYFFSDIGPLRIQQVGVADAAVDWHEDDGLVVGRDPNGAPACVLLLNAPARLREAREIIACADHVAAS